MIPADLAGQRDAAAVYILSIARPPAPVTVRPSAAPSATERAVADGLHRTAAALDGTSITFPAQAAAACDEVRLAVARMAGLAARTRLEDHR